MPTNKIICLIKCIAYSINKENIISTNCYYFTHLKSYQNEFILNKFLQDQIFRGYVQILKL